MTTSGYDAAMPTQPPALTARILGSLAAVDGLTGRSEAMNRLAAMPTGCPAAAEATMSRLIGAEPVRAAMVQIVNSLDHLVAWRHCLSQGLQPAVAHITLIRASLEASVVARWLVDPTEAPLERLARVAEWLREDYLKRRRVEDLSGIVHAPPGKSAAQRLADLDAEVAALGLRPLRRVNLTDICRGYCAITGDHGEVLYSTASAIAHGRPWAALLLEAARAGPGIAPDGAVMITVADDELAATMTAHAIRTATLAVEDVERHLTPVS